jgi:hypothetical protein
MTKTWGIALLSSFALMSCAHQSTDDLAAARVVAADPARPAATLAEVTLVDFGNPAQAGWLSGTERNSFATDADGTLRVSFYGDRSRAGNVIRLKPDTPWDLARYPDHNLAFEIVNLSDISMTLTISVLDEEGGRQERLVAIPANFDGTAFFNLTGIEARTETGLWGVPKSWETDDLLINWRTFRRDPLRSSRMSSIEFQVTGLLSDRNVVIRNLRLRPNPERSSDPLHGLVNEFGQATGNTPKLTVSSEEELRAIANAELAELANVRPLPDRSTYGGYKNGPRREATGFFRTEKVDGKWWLVDPQGYLFFSNGLANIRMANLTSFTGRDYRDDSVRYRDPQELTPEDSIGIVAVDNAIRKNNFVANPIRYAMFEWLPDYDGTFAEHYSYSRSSHHGPMQTGETFSFYRANLERRYGETSPLSYMKKWEDVTLARMTSWGFTSFGNWVDPVFYDNKQVPYFANGWIIGSFKKIDPGASIWGAMPDVFDPLFAQRARATVSMIAEEVQGSEWCIGVFVDNEMSWGRTFGTPQLRYGLVLGALSLEAAESPAKAAFTAALRDKYGDIGALNAAWNTDIASWEAFGSSNRFSSVSEPMVADLSMLLRMYGDQYFKTVAAAMNEYMPNHMYLGARLARWGMPKEIVAAAAQYSDLLSFNNYDYGVQKTGWEVLVEHDLPAIIGEFHIGTVNGSGQYHPGLIAATDQDDRAQLYARYISSVTAHPNFVGVHWFEYVDQPTTGRAYDGQNANTGFVNALDIPYPELVESARKVNRELYPKRYGK